MRIRYLLLLFWLFVQGSGFVNAQSSKEAEPEAYERALQLIHAYSGAGDELKRGMELAHTLSKTHPNGGYVQTLQAEALSTWRLNQQGQPDDLRAYIINLTDEALRLNPNLAQAYVARARALLRASSFDEANRAIDAALKLKPTLNGAMFLRAEFFRRTSRVSEAEAWYMKFIDATPDRPRKSNGYYWLGKTYQDAAARQTTDRIALIAKATKAYESMVELDPNGAWKTVNFAIFLNNDAADFDSAERYAKKALSIMDFPMARYHLAIARYQKLSVSIKSMDDKTLLESIRQIDVSTGIPFEEALGFSACCSGIESRLLTIQTRLASIKK